MKNQKGFTLAELLIVMAIIVVLAAVAIPTFGKQLETSRETNDMETIRNIYTDVLSYAIKDGADGKLDGNIGSLALPNDAGIVAVAETEANDAENAYTVTLSNWMSSAKFAQNGTAAVGSVAVAGSWMYVGSKLMGLTVPPVNVKTATLTFTFQFSGEEVAPKGVTVTGANPAITDGLFLPA